MSMTKNDRELMEAFELFMKLGPAAKQECRVYLLWLVNDGRPETDPTRDDLAWQEFKRGRDSAEADHAA
jgi:hypothetical protein